MVQALTGLAVRLAAMQFAIGHFVHTALVLFAVLKVVLNSHRHLATPVCALQMAGNLPLG